MAAEGVRVDSARVVAGGRTAVSTILVDPDGERLVVPYYDPALDPSPDWLPLERLRSCGCLLCDVRWPAGAVAALGAAAAAGVPTVLDADTAPQSVLKQLVPLATYPIFSLPALLAFTGMAEPGHPSQRPDSQCCRS